MTLQCMMHLEYLETLKGARRKLDKCKLIDIQIQMLNFKGKYN